MGFRTWRIRKTKELNYNEFKKKIFQKLNEDEKNILFFFSLFDPSGWEEININLKPIEKEIARNVFTIIKKHSKKIHKEYMGGSKKEFFIQKFVYSDKLCKFLISCELEQRGINIYKESLFNQFKFPDIVAIKKDYKTLIEIKRLVSCSNLKKRLEEEVINKIRNLKEKRNITKSILVLLFPSVNKENPFRIHQIIEGFYILEDYITEKCECEVKLLCHYINKSHDEFSFNVIIEKLLKHLMEEI